jgi:hypothetical protein
MTPYAAKDEDGMPVWAVKVQIGERVFKREFPQTPEGKEQAEKHNKRLNEAILHESRSAHPHKRPA